MNYKRKSFWKIIKNFFFKRKIFLIGDLHLDHKNIIRYCHRPFISVEQMNEILVNNWNKVIGKRDIVYFLGDLTFKHQKIGYWLRRLNGTIIFISGNHDRALRRKYFKKIITYNNVKFLLIHDPRHIPEYWKGWVIHGHKHNNDLVKYPFINGIKGTINVGVELINYKPISIDYLLKLNLNKIKRMETINNKPILKR